MTKELVKKFNHLKIDLNNIYFYTPTSTQLDSQNVKKKIGKIKRLQSAQPHDFEIFRAEYDLANYFFAHGSYESALIFFNRLLILMEKLSWGFSQEADFLKNFNIISIVLHANIGHCYFQLRDLRNAYLPYLHCSSLLKQYFPEKILEHEFILRKNHACLFAYFEENFTDTNAFHQKMISKCKEEELLKQQRFQKSLKNRKHSLKILINFVEDKNIEFNFQIFQKFANFFRESSYLGDDKKFYRQWLSEKF